MPGLLKYQRVNCSHCNKIVLRTRRRVNESNKMGWKTYCSDDCQQSTKNSKTTLKCFRGNCPNLVQVKRSELLRFKNHYCSHKCRAMVTNSLFPRRIAVIKTCLVCGKNYKGEAIKYCSTECKNEAATISKDTILIWIKKYYSKNNRIPLKREYNHYHAARFRFGSWNNAIKATGFDPNPVMFANKHVAKDGHRCDSLSEKIIDDWLYARKIDHKLHFPYPGNLGFTVDFKINKYWVEFFGLSGELKRYDELKEKKTTLAKNLKLNLVEIYPDDLFPISKLNNILSFLIK